jgi:hypothetical protein
MHVVTPATTIDPPCESLYFLHIPKTAGTSLRFWLHDLFADSQWLPCHILDEVDRADRSTLNRFPFLSGHFGWKIYEYIDHAPPALTWLREPVKRELSNYHFNRSCHDELVQIAQQNGRQDWIEYYQSTHAMSLIELYRSDRYIGFSDNLQTRYLAGVFPSKQAVEINEQILATAKKNLSDMLFVGICEWMRPSIDLLCYRLGVPSRPLNLTFNRTTKKKNASPELTDADLATIAEVNRFDQELYRFACQLFRQRFAGLWRRVDSGCSILDMDSIAARYEDPDTQAALRQVLNEHFQSVRRETPRSSPLKLSFRDPIFQSGWYERFYPDESTVLRWAGPTTNCSIHAPLPAGIAHRLQFTIRQLANYELLKNLRLRVNGQPIPIRFSRAPRSPNGAYQFNVEAEIPGELIDEKRTYTELVLETAGDLVSTQNGDPRLVSFATDEFLLEPIWPAAAAVDPAPANLAAAGSNDSCHPDGSCQPAD